MNGSLQSIFLIVPLRWLIVEYFCHQLQLYLVQHVHWWQPICSQLVTRCNTSFNMNMICINLPYCLEVSFLVSRCVGRQAVAADSLPFHVIEDVFSNSSFCIDSLPFRVIKYVLWNVLWNVLGFLWSVVE